MRKQCALPQRIEHKGENKSACFFTIFYSILIKIEGKKQICFIFDTHRLLVTMPVSCMSLLHSTRTYRADHKKGAPPPSHHLALVPRLLPQLGRLPKRTRTDGRTRTHTPFNTPPHGREEAAVVARAGCGSGSLKSIDAAGAAAFATRHTSVEKRSHPPTPVDNRWRLWAY